MSRSRLTVQGAEAAELLTAFRAIRTEFDIPADFPADVLAAAQVAAVGPAPPSRDARDLPLVTIDPAGSRDLDQAFHISAARSGHRIHYAIADVASFVVAGDPIDVEARHRGATLYAPDGRVPLHPPVLSEGAASLLPGRDRPAVLWTIDIDEAGETTAVHVERAVVRSREQFDYASAQLLLDAGTASPGLSRLRDAGQALQEAERRRGGIDLRITEQEVTGDATGYSLRWRTPVPVEGWNAQLSLLTGRAAATLMLDAGVGVLRTLPAAPEAGVQQLRRAASALDVAWPEGSSYAEVLRSLDPARPSHAAFLQQATALLRGSGYLALGDPAVAVLPGAAWHTGVAAPYAHVTAPLRRLVDRFASECCLAACRGEVPPEWVGTALPELPRLMAASDRRANAVERAYLDAVEAAMLRGREGETFAAVVLDADEKSGTIQLVEPPVRARCDGAMPLGERVTVRVVDASVADRRLRFAAV